MLIGNIRDFSSSDFSSANIRKAFGFIAANDLMSLKPGRTDIDGDKVYVNRSSYVAKPFSETKIEGHERYLDLQLVLDGAEGFGYVDKRKDGLRESVPYDSDKDRANYVGELDGIINLRPGFFALVYPNDLHQPGIRLNGRTVEKAVFKIRIDD